MVKHIDNTWSSNFLDLLDYGIKNNKCYRYVPVVVDNFSKHGWNIPLKKQSFLFVTNQFPGINNISNRKASIIETDDGKDFINKLFT